MKNRLFRSSISGQFDDYNGHGSNARLNWEEHIRGAAASGPSSRRSSRSRSSGRILVRYAMIDDDNKIGFWSSRSRSAFTSTGAKFILQLSHSGRQQDIGGVENLHNRALSSTGKKDFFHGILCQRMTLADIRDTVRDFAEGARRAKEAGLDGVELHGANGYLITQFLSSAINDRTDSYGGSVANRARFVLDIVRAIRDKVGSFHLQMKINGMDHNDWLYPWEKKGNALAETLEICSILEDGGHGVDAFHVSSGSTFPHPRNPPGDIPIDEARRWYDVMRSSGVRAKFNDFIFSSSVFGRVSSGGGGVVQRGPSSRGSTPSYAREVKKFARVPVLCTGGFQHANIIAAVIREGWCDAVTMARPLIANPDLPHIFETQNGPDPGRECIVHSQSSACSTTSENPLGLLRTVALPRRDVRGDVPRDDEIGDVGVRPARVPDARTRPPSPLPSRIMTATAAPETPTEVERARAARRRWLIVLFVLFLIGTYLFWRIVPQPAETYADIQEHYKYGSTGGDNSERGVPYRLWKVLPEMFPEHLPGGGKDRGPGYDCVRHDRGTRHRIGPSGSRKLPRAGSGSGRVSNSAAICHVGSMRATPESQRQIVLGMPSNTVDLQAYFRFLFACALDERFTEDAVMARIKRAGAVSIRTSASRTRGRSACSARSCSRRSRR